MPAPRNFQREVNAHDGPTRQLAIYTTLRAHVPDLDHALIGHRAILEYLHRLGIRRLNNAPLNWRIVLRWRTLHACPILRGNRARSYKSPSLTTTHALTAWLLATFATGLLFRIDAMALESSPGGSFPATQQRAA